MGIAQPHMAGHLVRSLVSQSPREMELDFNNSKAMSKWNVLLFVKNLTEMVYLAIRLKSF